MMTLLGIALGVFLSILLIGVVIDSLVNALAWGKPRIEEIERLADD